MGLGYVLQNQGGDQKSISKKQLTAYLDVAMAGRAAEEVVFGGDSITTGAFSDIEQATKIARTMVEEYGMNSEVGMVLKTDEMGEAIQNLMDGQVRKLLEDSYS